MDTEIIELKYYTNYGEYLDIYYVKVGINDSSEEDKTLLYFNSDEYPVKYVLHSDGGVLFGSNVEVFTTKYKLDYPSYTHKDWDDEAIHGEIFYYNGQYGYIDFNMKWRFPPVNKIEDCQFYKGKR